MTPSTRLEQFCAALTLLTALSAQAQMDVDQADSLNFESFHTNKAEAVKIWDTSESENSEIKKTFTEDKASITEQAPANVKADTDSNTGQRFEIRELYSITGSDRTDYNPNTVVQALFLQMQGLCANGWKKLDERSVPDGKEFYMHYQFECL